MAKCFVGAFCRTRGAPHVYASMAHELGKKKCGRLYFWVLFAEVECIAASSSVLMHAIIEWIAALLPQFETWDC